MTTAFLHINAAECGMRSIASGYKNCLSIGLEKGGKTGPIACTVIETAEVNAIDLHARLVENLGRISDYEITEVNQLPPWNGTGSGQIEPLPQSHDRVKISIVSVEIPFLDELILSERFTI